MELNTASGSFWRAATETRSTLGIQRWQPLQPATATCRCSAGPQPAAAGATKPVMHHVHEDQCHDVTAFSPLDGGGPHPPRAPESSLNLPGGPHPGQPARARPTRAHPGRHLLSTPGAFRGPSDREPTGGPRWARASGPQRSVFKCVSSFGP